MVKKYNFNVNSLGETTVWDVKKQKSVGGTINPKKRGWFVFKTFGSKIKLTHPTSLNKSEATKKLKTLFKN